MHTWIQRLGAECLSYVEIMDINPGFVVSNYDGTPRHAGYHYWVSAQGLVAHTYHPNL